MALWLYELYVKVGVDIIGGTGNLTQHVSRLYIGFYSMYFMCRGRNEWYTGAANVRSSSRAIEGTYCTVY